MLKVREGAWPAFLHCIFLRLWKQGLQSIVAQCHPKSKDTSTERKKSDDESFQGQAASEPLTHKQETLVKVQEAWRFSPHQGQK